MRVRVEVVASGAWRNGALNASAGVALHASPSICVERSTGLSRLCLLRVHASARRAAGNAGTNIMRARPRQSHRNGRPNGRSLQSARSEHLMGDDPECDGAAGAGGLRGVRPRDRTAAAPCVGGELRPGGGAGGDGRRVELGVGALGSHRRGQQQARLPVPRRPELGSAKRVAGEPGRFEASDEPRLPNVEPALLPALAKLSASSARRCCSCTATAGARPTSPTSFDVNVSTLRERLARGLIRLRTTLGVNDAC